MKRQHRRNTELIVYISNDNDRESFKLPNHFNGFAIRNGNRFLIKKYDSGETGGWEVNMCNFADEFGLFETPIRLTITPDQFFRTPTNIRHYFPEYHLEMKTYIERAIQKTTTIPTPQPYGREYVKVGGINLKWSIYSGFDEKRYPVSFS